jgi:hypothetical protein
VGVLEENTKLFSCMKKAGKKERNGGRRDGREDGRRYREMIDG